jgi:ATP synthase F1 epsilon subunit|tara:strand:- start:99 stop:497 length:399 start_codon:yes stop_codon:yes gene_type:complete
MSENFNIEIVNPEKSFLSKENVTEVVVPAFEGEIGILKDHIPIISFLKPGIIKVFIGSEEENYYVEDGIVEFKDNSLSILTSSIFNLKDIDKNHISNSISEAENELSKDEIDDQKRFILNHKVEVLKSISTN